MYTHALFNDRSTIALAEATRFVYN